MKNAIISFANSKGNYVKGLARLSDSLRNNFDGDFLSWVHESALGAPLHEDNPYAFKLYAFEKAFELGYENVLWLDTSAYAVKNLAPIFDIINQKGYFFQEAGHLLGEWSNDNLLSYYNLTRDEAMSIPMVMGGIIGFKNIPAQSTAYSKLWGALHAGIFRGEWNNNEKTESQDERCNGHRHEMSAISAIVHQMGLSWSPQVIQYGGYFDETRENTIIKFQGM